MSQEAAAVSRSDDKRRTGYDRRCQPTPLVSRYTFVGRRHGCRRTVECRNVYVDRFTGAEWAMVTGIMVLSMLDLVFTLMHLGAGGREANPVMDWFLQRGGTDAFSGAKILFTVIGLLVLLIHVKFDRVRALMRFAFGLYTLLFVFHLYVMYLRLA